MGRLLLAALLAVTLAGCASFHSAKIADLEHRPNHYRNHTVSIDGVVTSSWGVPLVPFRFYKVADETGEVTVLSDGRRSPVTGEHVRVKGRVEDVAAIGGRAIGLHLREENVHIKR
jgi:uncharacterized protein YceK